MLNKDTLYGQITSLIEDPTLVTENFFKGLAYKENYTKVYNLFNELSKNFDGIEIYYSFDYTSEDEYISTFRALYISNDKELYKYLKKLKKKKEYLINSVEIDNDMIIILFD